VPFTLIIEIFGLLAAPHTPAPAHAEPTFATFDQATKQIAARTRPICFLGDLRIALQLHLGFLIDVRHDEGWRLTPDPFTGRPVAPTGFEGAQLRFIFLTIPGESRLAIVVARVPGIGAVGQDVPDRCWLPDLVLARRGWNMRLVQTLRNLATTQVVFDQQPIDVADDLGLPRRDHDMRRGIVPSR
jgi:hypothetical protein